MQTPRPHILALSETEINTNNESTHLLRPEKPPNFGLNYMCCQTPKEEDNDSDILRLKFI